ncbi:OmpH family outer membrane protein [Aliikangiella marina]|uniref:OmpH family outer membrane protein n=1 Tax=Aliikangiella marina TaxID=1712262 RepID=UPI00163DAB6F|nr:OmpH family outer membrane protein [Aliikangiella marina]
MTFDAQQALLRTKVAQKKFERLRAKPEFAKIMKNAEELQASLKKLDKTGIEKGMTWTDQERVEHRKKMEFIQADLKLAGQKIQSEQSALMNTIMTELEPKLGKVLSDYMEQQDIDIILRKEAIFISKPVADITEDIIKELDKLN